MLVLARRESPTSKNSSASPPATRHNEFGSLDNYWSESGTTSCSEPAPRTSRAKVSRCHSSSSYQPPRSGSLRPKRRRRVLAWVGYTILWIGAIAERHRAMNDPSRAFCRCCCSPSRGAVGVWPSPVGSSAIGSGSPSQFCRTWAGDLRLGHHDLADRQQPVPPQRLVRRHQQPRRASLGIGLGGGGPHGRRGSGSPLRQPTARTSSFGSSSDSRTTASM